MNSSLFLAATQDSEASSAHLIHSLKNHLSNESKKCLKVFLELFPENGLILQLLSDLCSLWTGRWGEDKVSPREKKTTPLWWLRFSWQAVEECVRAKSINYCCLSSREFAAAGLRLGKRVLLLLFLSMSVVHGGHRGPPEFTLPLFSYPHTHDHPLNPYKERKDQLNITAGGV